MQNPCRRGKEAFFPHPQDETKFIQCSDFGQMFEFVCPPGLIWNQPTASCQKGQATSLNPIKKVSETVKPIVEATTPKHTVTTTPTLVITTQPTINIMTSTDNSLKISFQKFESNSGIEISSSIIFDNEICTNLEIKNNNSPFINGIYTKSDGKVFRRSDIPQVSGFIGVVRDRWWVIFFYVFFKC